ncbi:MAG: hypothetical protein VB137_16445 [Burkholderia sp.]
MRDFQRDAATQDKHRHQEFVNLMGFVAEHLTGKKTGRINPRHQRRIDGDRSPRRTPPSLGPGR